MTKAKSDHRAISSTRSPSRNGEDARLIQLLYRLVSDLGRIRRGDPLPDVRCGATPERWEDKSYVYLEVNLHDLTCPEIDISVQEGLAFIRIER